MQRPVAVLQSNYIPWKGYFDIIHDVDLFIFHDDLQFTKNDWRNRNRIKTRNGTQWLTIPVGTDCHRLICEVQIKDPAWQIKHWNVLQNSYRRAPYFALYESFFREVYIERRWSSLSTLNQFIIQRIARDYLGVTTAFADSRQFQLQGAKLDRLLDLLKQAGATRYVSGPSAKSYIDLSRFADAGIEVVWKSYDKYREYAQLYPPFTHLVSVVDLLFHTGPAAADFIWNRQPTSNRD